MEALGIEQALRKAVLEQQSLSGDDHIEVARRLGDLAKHLVAQKQLEEAEPVLARAVTIVASHALRQGRQGPPAEYAPMVESYELLLKMLGMNREQRQLKLRARIDRARLQVFSIVA